MGLVLNAVVFAERAHRKQVRKYTGEPYIVHPLEVAQIVSSVPHTDEMLAAALLHDTVEDCNVTLDQIEKAFNKTVRELVWWLTDVSDKSTGNRETRKARDREHIATAPAQAQTIKLADLISNTQSIAFHDPVFAGLYMKEKHELLKVLTRGDKTLYSRAKGLVHDWHMEDR